MAPASYSLGLQASSSLGLGGYSLGLYDLVLDPLTAEADLVVVGMVGKLVEVNVVCFLHQHGLKILGKRKRNLRHSSSNSSLKNVIYPLEIRRSLYVIIFTLQTP